jgi:hypothetical protein
MSSTRQAAASTSAIERSAFNAAFYELGLRWQWDDETYEALAADPCERQRVRRYLEREQPHLLRAYDADFLASAILEVKQRFQRSSTPGTSSTAACFDCGDVGF